MAEEPEEAPTGKVIDLMEALQASLDSGRRRGPAKKKAATRRQGSTAKTTLGLSRRRFARLCSLGTAPHGGASGPVGWC